MYAIEVIRHLEREARETARLARAAQVDALNALALVTCSGCSHPKHVALRCTTSVLSTRESACGCDLHFGLWPDDPAYPEYVLLAHVDHEGPDHAVCGGCVSVLDPRD